MEYDFEKLAREIVIAKLKDSDDPSALAAELVHKIAVSAIASTRGRQEPRVTVAAACRGVMAGVLISEKDLPKTAVVLIAQMARIAQETNLDPAECMTWAMEGIASVVKVAPGGAADAVGAAIAENFMGAGEVFEGLVRTTGPS